MGGGVVVGVGVGCRGGGPGPGPCPGPGPDPKQIHFFVIHNNVPDVSFNNMSFNM